MEDSAISARRMTPWHTAALAGHLHAVDWPLKHGIDPESPGSTWQRGTNDHIPNVSLLRERCATESRLLAAVANTNVPGGHHGGSVLNRAIIAGDRDLSALLRDAGGSPTNQDLPGKTSLHQAVNRNAELIQLVLSVQPDTSNMVKMVRRQSRWPGDSLRMPLFVVSKQ